VAYKVFLKVAGEHQRRVRARVLMSSLAFCAWLAKLNQDDRKRAMKENERFWNVDLRVLLLQWWQDIWVFVATALTFVALALPVIIPTLILWYLLSINFTVKP
jgi:hypothetical protein